MQKITMTVDRERAVDAMIVAFDYKENYMAKRQPDMSMILTNHGQKYLVHHVKSGTIVIKQKK